MNYELAKKLKEAGFPQGKGIIGSSHHVVFSDVHTDSDGNLITSGDALEVPTLEELIEACNELNILEFPLDLEKQLGKNIRAISSIFVDSDEEECVTGIGSTHIEAVANLWLALNKKRDI